MEQSHSTMQLVNEQKKPSHGPQYLAAFSACMGAFCFGIAIGFSAPAGVILLRPNGTDINETDTLYLSEGELSWYGSTFNIGAFMGGPIAGFLIDAIGRKRTMLSTFVVFLTSWLLTIFAQNFAMLISSRVIVGIAAGITCIAANTYVGELASVDIRGTLGSGFQLMVVIGIEYAYIFGAFIEEWQVLSAVCLLPAFIFLLLVLIAKESPVYLLSKGRGKEATASLQYFRGKNYNVQQELDVMRSDLEEAKANKTSVKDLFTNSYLLKPLLISLALMLFQQFSGVNAVLFNLTGIFQEAGSDIPDSLCSVLVGLIQIVATAASSFLIDRAGRKILLLGSSSLMAVSLGALGIFFYLKEEGQADSIGWLPLTSLMLFITAFSIGYGPIPWLMMNELFPRAVAGNASSLSTMVNWSSSFICTLAFAPLKAVIYDYGVFWLFAAVCVMNVAFCILIVPETKGKTVEEIGAIFGAPTASKNYPKDEKKSGISTIS